MHHFYLESFVNLILIEKDLAGIFGWQADKWQHNNNEHISQMDMLW